MESTLSAQKKKKQYRIGLDILLKITHLLPEGLISNLANRIIKTGYVAAKKSSLIFIPANYFFDFFFAKRLSDVCSSLYYWNRLFLEYFLNKV